MFEDYFKIKYPNLYHNNFLVDKYGNDVLTEDHNNRIWLRIQDYVDYIFSENFLYYVNIFLFKTNRSVINYSKIILLYTSIKNVHY